MKTTFHAAILVICVASGACAQGPDGRAGATGLTNASPLDKMPRDLEVRYALSALPPHLRADATTYVLDPDKGYELNHKGTMDSVASSSVRNRNGRTFATTSTPQSVLTPKDPRRFCRSGWTPQR